MLQSLGDILRVQKLLSAILFQGVPNCDTFDSVSKECFPEEGWTACSISSRRVTFPSCSLYSPSSTRECSSWCGVGLAGKRLAEVTTERCKCTVLRTGNQRAHGNIPHRPYTLLLSHPNLNSGQKSATKILQLEMAQTVHMVHLTLFPRVLNMFTVQTIFQKNPPQSHSSQK